MKVADTYFKNIQPHENNYKFIHSKTILFEYKDGELLENIMSDLYMFSKLIAFNTNKKECLEIILFNEHDNNDKVKNINIHKVNSHSIRVVNFTQYYFSNIDQRFFHQSDMLFSKFIFDDDILRELTKNWYNNLHLVHLYDYYIDTNNQDRGNKIMPSNVKYNNQFLNLIQGLEFYYKSLDLKFIRNNEKFTKDRQELKNMITDNYFIKWIETHLKKPRQKADLIDKLNYLIDKFEGIFNKIDGLSYFTEKYSVQAKDYRHKLSHGDIKKTYQGPEFDNVYSFSKILLCFCILDSLGLSIKGIQKVNNSNFYLKQEFKKILNVK